MPDADTERPNVLVFICDDLGYGDLACHGNTAVETPELDALYGESARPGRFYGTPVCTPSRASLMTGRWHLRTGAIDTYKGRSMMAPDEITLAECLSDADYATGLFGKWHLGDNYPLRPHDRGFDEALYHQGGGLCQPAGKPGESYWDPLLWHNGDPERGKGFCTDVYTDAAIEFLEEHAGSEDPFFAYVASNAPHTPLQAPDDAAAPYLEAGYSEDRARFYGMVSNISKNVGRLLGTLERAGVADETIVIFTSDHGPALHQDEAGRFRTGLRGGKGSVYEGGIRVPFFLRWPGELDPGERDVRGHFVDVLPTLLDACGGESPTDRPIDGETLLPALGGGTENSGTEGQGPDLSERLLFQQWHRGDEPQRYRSCAVVGERFKLVNGDELYDLAADPGETRNVAAEHPEVVTRLREAYEAWFTDVTAGGYDPVRIRLGTEHENPTRLTRQEARCVREGEGWRSETALSEWAVTAPEGVYDVTLRFRSRERGRGESAAVLRFGGVERERGIGPWQSECTFEEVRPGGGDARLAGEVVDDDGGRYGVRYAVVERTDL
jgi:arylsulfatase A-like enzyme